MKMKKLILFLIFLSFISCNYKDEIETPIEITRNLTFNSVRIGYDSFSIRIDTSKERYYKISFCKDSLYFGYNFKRNNIDIYNLRQKAYTRSIPVGKNILKGIFVHTFDSVFILSENSILLLNENGHVLKEIKVNANNKSHKRFFRKNYLMFDTENPTIFFNSIERKLYLSNIEPVYGTCSKKHFLTPILATIDIDTEQPDLKPIYFSDSYHKAYYGFQTDPRFNFSNNKIIYNFPIDSRVFVYDNPEDSIISYRMVSKLCNNSALPIPDKYCQNDDKKMEYFAKDVCYYKVLSLTSINRYAQLKEDTINLNEIGKNGEFKTINDKKQILSIFDAEFNYIGEYKLIQKFIPQNAFVYQNSIFLISPTKKDYLNFSIIKIN